MPKIPDFSLSDGVETYDCMIEDGASVTQGVFSEDRALAIDLSSQGKKIGEFDEQRSWKGGRGSDYFDQNPEGYHDGQMAWTLNKDILTSGLQWRMAKGLRVGQDFSLPGNIEFTQIYPGSSNPLITRYISQFIVAGSTVTGLGYTAALIGLWIRKVGTPGTLTVEICNNNAGVPGTVRTTGTLTTASVTDIISQFVEIVVTANALTAGTVYHIKIYGASTDTQTDHWQIGIDRSTANLSLYSNNNTGWNAATYGIHYWVGSAAIPRRLWLFQLDGSQYAVTKNDDGSASNLYINGARGKATAGTTTTLTDTNASFGGSRYAGAYVRIIRGAGAFQISRITSATGTVLTVSPAFAIAPTSTSEYIIYYTDVWTEITGHGLGVVYSRPTLGGTASDIIYFPQGAVTMRRMRFNAAASPPAHEFAADGTNIAYFLSVGTTLAGAKMYAAINNGQTKSAALTAWNVNLTFDATAVVVGGDTSRMNGMNWDKNKNALIVYKEDDAWAVDSSNKATRLDYDFNNNQSYLNGVASVSAAGFTYYTWLHSLMQVYGSTSTDVGLSFRGEGSRSDKLGYYAALISANGWIFAALDGLTQTSSINVYDGQGWHEILQAPAASKRIRDVQWQTCEETGYNRLWTDMGGYIVYQDFPAYTNKPYTTSGINYQHETIIESSILDKGTSSRLLKYIKDLTVVSENLTSGNCQIFVDWQTDNDIFSTRWRQAGALNISPEDNVKIDARNINRFAYRLRMYTKNCIVPVIIRGIAPSGFARVPFKLTFTARIKVDKLKVTGSNEPTDFNLWLTKKAMNASPLTLRSDKHPLLNGANGRLVIISPPSITITAPEKGRRTWRGLDTITLMEV